MKFNKLSTLTLATLLGFSGASFAACDAASAGENSTFTECNTDNSTNIDSSTNIDNSHTDNSHTEDSSSRIYGGDHIENPNVVNINKGQMFQQQAVLPK